VLEATISHEGQQNEMSQSIDCLGRIFMDDGVLKRSRIFKIKKERGRRAMATPELKLKLRGIMRMRQRAGRIRSSRTSQLR
jgi:hypothetical protein